jgi:DNA polymerase-4
MNDALTIVHVDLDQFYAAVEILDFPELKGKPVIVGGRPDSRGVVSTASYEARVFGVRSAMPSAQAARLCPQAIWRTPRMSRYAEKSREIRTVFERYTDQIEPLSLDEAFLDLAGSLKLFGSAEKIGRRIKDEIFKETGLVASVGVAENKFLAKIASDLQKPNGFVVIPPGRESAEKVLFPLPVSRLWGVGPKTGEQLTKSGITTIADLAAADPAWLARRLGNDAAEHLQRLAHGVDARDVESGARSKSIGRENTFAQDLRNREDMERELLAFADEVAARLRSERIKCRGVTLKVKFADFTRISRALMLEDATDLSEPLYQAVKTMLRDRVDFKGKGVRLLGLAATHLESAGRAAQSLFPDANAERQTRAAQAIDKLRSKFGDSAITFGRLLEDRQDNTGTPRG